MMLKEIRFKNWKSFRDAKLYFDPLTVLIGANASGKSNALDGIELLSKIISGVPLAQALNEIRGSIEWAANKHGNSFTLEAVVQVDRWDIDILYSITVDTSDPALPVFLDETLSSIKNSNSEGTGRSRVIVSLKKIADEFQKANVGLNIPYIADSSVVASYNGFDRPNLDRLAIKEFKQTINSIFLLDPIPTRMRDYSPVAKILNKDASNLAGVLSGLGREEKISVEKSITEYVKQLPERDIRKVFTEPVGRLKKDAMLYCEEEWLDGEPSLLVDASGMSDGTLRFIAILTALLTRPEGSTIIIEEVDDGLHPSRANLLLDLLNKIGSERNIDVLVTTHNPALLDALGPEMVPFVVVAHRSQQSGESQLTLLEDIQNLPKLLASGPIGKIVTKGEIEKSLAEGQGQKDHE